MCIKPSLLRSSVFPLHVANVLFYQSQWTSLLLLFFSWKPCFSDNEILHHVNVFYIT